MNSLIASRVGEWQRGGAHRRVLSAAATVAVFTVAVKLAGAAKEVLVAQRFGTSDAVDAFVLAFLLPSFAISVVGGSLNTALIPAYVETRQVEGAAAARRLLSSTLVLSIGLLVGVAGVLAWLVPVLLPLVSSQFSHAKLRLTAELSYLLLPCLVVAGTTMTWAAVLNAHGRFAPSAAAGLAVPFGAVAGVALLGRTWGIHALAVGMFAGYCVEAVIVGAALRKEGVRLVPRWGGLTPGVRRVAGQYAPMLAGMLVMSTNPVIDSVMAARLAPGSVAALGYGNKLVAFALGIGASSLGAAVLPHFSQLAADRDWTGMRRTLRVYALAILTAAVPATIALVALSTPIVRMLFERGAFTAADTAQVARIQALYLVQLPFHLVGLLFVRFISAVSANRVLMWISIVNAVVNVAGNYLLASLLGAAGIALSTSLVYVVAFAISLTYTVRRLRQLCAPQSGPAVPELQ